MLHLHPWSRYSCYAIPNLYREINKEHTVDKSMSVDSRVPALAVVRSQATYRRTSKCQDIEHIVTPFGGHLLGSASIITKGHGNSHYFLSRWLLSKRIEGSTETRSWPQAVKRLEITYQNHNRNRECGERGVLKMLLKFGHDICSALSGSGEVTRRADCVGEQLGSGAGNRNMGCMDSEALDGQKGLVRYAVQLWI